MLNINGTTDYSILFNSLPGNKTNTVFNNVNIGDFAKVKNGSYKKLLKSYYAEMDKQEKASKNSSKASDTSQNISSKIDTSKKNATAIKSAASDLNNKIKSLKDYSKVTDETVSDFVNKYNDLQLQINSSSQGNVSAAVSGLTNLTKKNTDALSKIGITTDGNKLKFDADKFKNASSDDIKAAFDSNSYLNNVSDYSTRIKNYSDQNIRQLSTYNQSAQVNATSTGTIFNDFI